MMKYKQGGVHMRILGIDPGIATIGFGVVDTAGPHKPCEMRCYHHPGAYLACKPP